MTRVRYNSEASLGGRVCPLLTAVGQPGSGHARAEPAPSPSAPNGSSRSRACDVEVGSFVGESTRSCVISQMSLHFVA